MPLIRHIASRHFLLLSLVGNHCMLVEYLSGKKLIQNKVIGVLGNGRMSCLLVGYKKLAVEMIYEML